MPRSRKYLRQQYNRPENELLTLYSLLGYGTWQASPGEVGQGVYEALKVGYRHLVSFSPYPLLLPPN